MCPAFSVDDTAEDRLGESFMAWVFEGGHGFSLTFQEWPFHSYSRFCDARRPWSRLNKNNIRDLPLSGKLQRAFSTRRGRLFPFLINVSSRLVSANRFLSCYHITYSFPESRLCNHGGNK